MRIRAWIAILIALAWWSFAHGNEVLAPASVPCITAGIPCAAILLPTIEPREHPRFERTRLTAEIRSERWFKPTVLTYWLIAAAAAYERDGDINLKSYGRGPRGAYATFEVDGVDRVFFVPRSTPVVLFPLRRARTARPVFLSLHITSKGGAVTIATLLPH